jgi:threonine synthase
MRAAAIRNSAAAVTTREGIAVASTVKTKTDLAYQRCVMPDCAATYDVGEVRTACDACGSLLDVVYDWDSLPVPRSLEAFEEKWSRRHEPLCFSGVWRFSDLLPFAPPNKIVTIGEGQTLLHPSEGVARYVGV